MNLLNLAQGRGRDNGDDVSDDDQTDSAVAPRAMVSRHDLLDAALLQFSPDDIWTIRDSFEGVQIFGGIGSGKTSGSGAAIAKAFLRSGYGGLVLCAKPEERELWEKYCAETGRSDDLKIFSEVHELRFNFIDYELNRTGRGGGQTENMVALLSHITEIAEGKQDQQGGESFWGRAMKELLRNTIDLLAIAEDHMSLEDISHVIVSAPQYPEQHQDEEWRENSYCWQCLMKARSKERDGTLTDIQVHDFRMVYRYWMRSYASLADRTRSGIVATFTSIADMFLHGMIRELFCTESNVDPDIIYKEGAILVIDLPIQEWHDVGRIAQGIWKYMAQRSVLRREIAVDPLPIFHWADESQNFVSNFDFRYQAVARSARAATVSISQNISNFYSVLGSNGRDESHALLGNLKTQMFHAQGNVDTNQYASDMISQQIRTMRSYGMSNNLQYDGGSNANASEGIHPKVLPAVFTTLRQGGPLNNWEVDGIVFQSGRVWKATGDTFLPVVFKQK